MRVEEAGGDDAQGRERTTAASETHGVKKNALPLPLPQSRSIFYPIDGSICHLCSSDGKSMTRSERGGSRDAEANCGGTRSFGRQGGDSQPRYAPPQDHKQPRRILDLSAPATAATQALPRAVLHSPHTKSPGERKRRVRCGVPSGAFLGERKKKKNKFFKEGGGKRDASSSKPRRLSPLRSLAYSAIPSKPRRHPRWGFNTRHVARAKHTGKRYKSHRKKNAPAINEEPTSMLQWYTAPFVTMPRSAGEIQRQNTTDSGIWWDFILDFISMLKICRWS